jgi:erythromycin esterase-like protein
VADLVQWMCEWNRTHRKPKDRLVFTRFDIQQPEDDGPGLIGFLERIGSDDASWIAAIEACEGVMVEHFPALVPEESHQQCLEGLEEIEEHFQRNARTLQRRTSKTDFELAKLRLVGLRAWENESFYRGRDEGLSYTSRDEGMAHALRTLRALRFPKSKIAVWAHNSHISRGIHPLNGARVMGSFLAEALGATYVNVALAAWRVGIDWISLGCGWLSDPLADSLERVLRDTGEVALLLDLDFPGAAEPLLTPGATYTVGGRPMVPREHFNGLLYLESSPKMNPTLWPSCQ